MPPILHLWLLGSFQAEIDTGSELCPLPPLPTRPARALLARLALAHPQPVPRARLVTDLFPGAAADRGAHHLRTTLYYLRRAIPGMLCSDESQAWLAAEMVLDVDVHHFETLSQPGATKAALEESARLYRGRFLESPPEGWAEEEARRLYNRYLDVLQRLVALSQASGNPGEALEAARRWAIEEPWEIKAHRALIAAYLTQQEYRSAEAQVIRARQILSGEWGQASDEAFESLARQVKGLAAKQLSSSSPASSSPLHSPAPPASRRSGAPQIDFDHLPLVDRVEEFGQLWEAWQRACQGEAGAVVLEGPAGIGKTRLASELAARARLQAGALVLWGVADESTAHVPMGLLRAAFARLDKSDLERVRKNCAGLPPVILSLLRRFIPELMLALPETEPLSMLDGPGELARRQTMLSALAQAILGKGPLLFVLENTHLADEETLVFLNEMLAGEGNDSTSTGGQCLAVLTRRPVGAAPDPSWSVIRLAPLSESGLQALLNQVLAGSQAGAVDGLVVEKIAARSGGNPLFTREILRLLVEQGRLGWDRQRGWQLLQSHIPLPDPVTDLLSQRLDSLSTPARALATLLAVLGWPADEALLDRLFQIAYQSFDGEVDGALASRKCTEMRLSAQAELLERQVLAEQADRLWFDHDWLGETLLASLDATSRATLHGQVALALGSPTGLDRAERMRHYLESGQWEPALEDALAAAEAAFSEQALPQLGRALHAVSSALEKMNVPSVDPRRWSYLRLTERYHSQTEHGPAWQQALNDLLACADMAGQAAWQVESLIRKASGLYVLGEYESAIRAGRTAAETAHAACLPAKEAEARELLVSIMIDWGNLSDAWPECEALLAAAQASADERLQCLALNGLVQLNILSGKVEEATALFIRLAQHPYVQKRSDWDMLRQMAIFSMAGRAYEPGLAWLRASAERAQQIGDVIGMVRSQAYLCFELANLGRYSEVQAIAEGVLPLACQLKEAYQEGFLYYSLAKAVFYGQSDPLHALGLIERGIARTESAGLTDPLTGLLGLEAQIYLFQGRSEPARAAIERAERLSPPSGVVFIDHIAARVWLAAGQPAKARTAALLALERAHDQGFLAVWAGEMLWSTAEVLAQVEGSGLARDARSRAYRRFADDLTRLESPSARRLFIQANPAHGELADFKGDNLCRIVWLPEVNAPTGRPLRADELAPVVWMLDEAGEPDRSTPAGRRARLQRLCQTALEQSAVATLEALADFLSASPRTIQRDLQALRESGVKAQTRGGK